jgi:hypothetical protein
MRTTLTYPLLLLIAAVGLAACDSSDPIDDVEPEPLVVERVEDIAADPAEHDPETGQALDLGQYAFYSLRDNELVLAYDAEDRADSTSAEWDIAFHGTDVIANAGNGGGIQVITGAFEEVTEAPEGGYLSELPSGSGNGWYNYANVMITPIPGRTIVVRTPDGLYAKVRVISYYESAPDEIDPTSDPSRYYTFDYVLQPDGTRSFEGVE